MGEARTGMLRTLAAEIRNELPLIDRTLGELHAITPGTGAGPEGRVHLYAASAVLDTYYTGVERVLERIARTFDAVPTGPHWHADLLAVAALDVPEVRPPVLSGASCAVLKRYLAFRHRFRNLYLFDLDAEQVAPLLQGASAGWTAIRADLDAFASALIELAEALERTAE
jgi:hypothetical protein